MIVDPYRLSIWNETKEKYKDTPEFPSIKYTNFEQITIYKQYSSTLIRFINSDMIEESCRLKLERKNPLLLNMSSWGIAGGGVDLGCPAQEEECFRRSNYFKTFTQAYHPFGLLDTVLSKDVEYYRKGFDSDYALMEQPVKIDMVAGAVIIVMNLKKHGRIKYIMKF